jgi:molybdenum cofactor guanylyltransferase
MRIFGVILAGGAARRMGGADKAMLRLGSATLLDLVKGRFAPQVEAVAISATGDLGRFGDDLPVLPDTAALGPLAGLLAAMGWAAQSEGDYIATCAVDTPHFPCDLVAQLHLAMEMQGARLALARGARVHATFGLWPVVLRGDLADFLASGANPKVQDFAARYRTAFAQFEGEAAFDNINTPADLARLSAMGRQGAGRQGAA